MTAREQARGRLLELGVHDLGVIDDLRLVLGPGMTALTGETGAGKTMLVEAIELLVGGRADAGLVRPGATEAVVEGRFELDGEERVLSRVIAAEGRSRAYVDGRMATAAALAELGARLVDLHGQHDHQSLLAGAVQREALDRFGGLDLEPLAAARADLRRIDAALADLGGDPGARAREVDLLRFQLDELEGAGLSDPDEDDALDAEEDRLGDAVAHREAAAGGAEVLGGDGGALDAVAAALVHVDGRAPFAAHAERLRSVTAELTDLAHEIREQGESIDDDPARLEEVRSRRQRLAELRRKYGTARSVAGDHDARGGKLADVIAYRDDLAERLDALLTHEQRAAALDLERTAAQATEREAAGVIAAGRRAAAPDLAAAVERHLRELAMPKARMEVSVEGPDPADEVRFLLAANPGTGVRPLAKVASGGELARTMLALRLVLSAAPPTLVFDEVDAGIGGEAALVVGRALADLGADHQVLVVTHLPQVAAFADAQVNVTKVQRSGTTVARAATLGDDERVVELSRMLSGTPQSERVREAASELLAVASRQRGR